MVILDGCLYSSMILFLSICLHSWLTATTAEGFMQLGHRLCDGPLTKEKRDTRFLAVERIISACSDLLGGYWFRNFAQCKDRGGIAREYELKEGAQY